MGKHAKTQRRSKDGKFAEEGKPAVTAAFEEPMRRSSLDVVHPRTGQTLITDEQMDTLLRHGEERFSDPERDWQHKPVVKLFGGGSGTWLISEINPENHDIMFGLCDLGYGTPELGTVSFNELRELRFKYGMVVERDEHWEPQAPLMDYAEVAWGCGSIQDNLAAYEAANSELASRIAENNEATEQTAQQEAWEAWRAIMDDESSPDNDYVKERAREAMYLYLEMDREDLGARDMIHWTGYPREAINRLPEGQAEFIDSMQGPDYTIDQHRGVLRLLHADRRLGGANEYMYRKDTQPDPSISKFHKGFPAPHGYETVDEMANLWRDTGYEVGFIGATQYPSPPWCPRKPPTGQSREVEPTETPIAVREAGTEAGWLAARDSGGAVRFLAERFDDPKDAFTAARSTDGEWLREHTIQPPAHSASQRRDFNKDRYAKDWPERQKELLDKHGHYGFVDHDKIAAQLQAERDG